MSRNVVVTCGTQRVELTAAEWGWVRRCFAHVDEAEFDESAGTWAGQRAFERAHEKVLAIEPREPPKTKG